MPQDPIPEYTLHVFFEGADDHAAVHIAQQMLDLINASGLGSFVCDYGDNPVLSQADDWAERVSLSCQMAGQNAEYRLWAYTEPFVVEVPECSGPLGRTGNGMTTCQAHREADLKAKACYDAIGYEPPEQTIRIREMLHERRLATEVLGVIE